MIPKEKAEELIEKYYQAIWDLVDTSTAFHYSKQCALIAVDEILNTFWAEGNQKDYWQTVKEEINLL